MDREDDKRIQDGDRLLRRIPPNQVIREDGIARPSSAAFKASELSVNIESLMIEQGRGLHETLNGHPGFALSSIVVSDVREFGHPIVRDNAPPNDPAHGLVLGKKRERFARAMTRRQHWIVPPEG